MAEGEVKIKIGAQDNASTIITRIQKNFKSFFAGFGLYTLGNFLLSETKNAMNFGAEMEKLQIQTGINVKSLQQLKYAAELSDVSFQTVTTGLKFLTRNMYGATQGNDVLRNTFKKLQVDIIDATTGALRPAEDVMADLADKFAAMESPEKAAALAMKLFGKQGTELLPFLKKGKDAIEELKQEASRLGVVMDQETIKHLAEYENQMKRTENVTKAMTRELGYNLAPALNWVNKALVDFLRWAKEHPTLPWMNEEANLKTKQAKESTEAYLNAVKRLNQQYYDNELTEKQWRKGRKDLDAANKRAVDQMNKEVIPAFAGGADAIDEVSAAIQKLNELTIQLSFNLEEDPKRAAAVEKALKAMGQVDFTPTVEGIKEVSLVTKTDLLPYLQQVGRTLIDIAQPALQEFATSFMSNFVFTVQRGKDAWMNFWGNFMSTAGQMIAKLVMLKLLKGAMTGGVGFFMQHGGEVPGGMPYRDRVPIMATPGEYVLSREAAQRIGRGNLDRLNYGSSTPINFAVHFNSVSPAYDSSVFLSAVKQNLPGMLNDLARKNKI